MNTAFNFFFVYNYGKNLMLIVFVFSRSKTQRDLENHQLTHCSENFWVCEQEDCDYSCRSKSVLQEHYAKNHSKNDIFLYHCHICSNKYKRGSHLTVHLKKEHSYRWASGHSRFKFVYAYL